ncbi:MAG: C-terminal processing peptidase [Bacteroidetes bacterium]|nr:MAG: C-terminal processing peptidase [Bacteroidota bacterium]
MKKYTKIFSISLPFVIAFSSCFFMSGKDPAEKQSTAKDEVILEMMVALLKQAHYSPQAIDDKFSERAFDLYMTRMDYQKKFLLQSDVESMKKEYFTKIDDEIRNNSFGFFNKSMDILNERMKEDQEYYRELLKKPFDFKVKESVELDPEKMKYPKDKAEMKDSWRKYLKYQVMVRYADLKKEQEKAKEGENKLKGMNDAALEDSARRKVLKLQDEAFERIGKVKREDRMATYLNVLTSVYDPHSEFFPPKDKANFDIAMSGQLEGIGAQLQEKEGFIKVTNIVPGSPSWKDGRLKAGDAIIKVGQGNKEPVDVVGMDIDDAIKMIRGKKGTEVRLTVKKPDGNTQVVELIRDVVILEETFAQSAVIQRDGKKLGYIKLPSFYADFNGVGAHSCADDVRKELVKLKAEGVEGIMLDLRDNGGGSLQEVVKMVGLFIDDGPVVQVRSSGNEIKTYEDPDRGQIVYEGPLAVMVNEGSASASEILAAAIQDYKRGVIVGSNSSYGKGTVQTFFDLDRLLTPENAAQAPLGQVKITIQKFYRVNGGATQLKGVIPDVVLPDMYAFIETGEKDMEFPMPWDEIAPKFYNPWKNAPDYAQLKANSNKRISEDAAFKMINARALEFKTERDNSTESLNIDDYLADVKRREADKDKYKLLEENVKGMDVIMPAVDKKAMESDTSKSARKTAWIDKLKKDVYVNEVAAIIKEMK